MSKQTVFFLILYSFALIFANSGFAEEQSVDEGSVVSQPDRVPAPQPRPVRAGARTRPKGARKQAVVKPQDSAANGRRFGIEALTFDFGASVGSYGSVQYTELNLGVNAYFAQWLNWRNAAFARLPSVGSKVYGWDSGARLVFDLSSPAVNFTAFGGPGYRFVSEGKGAPFLEAGAVFSVVGFSLGGGVKTILNSAVQSGAGNDTQSFIILAGGGSL